MTVAMLRQELKERGLETTGLKAALVERLQSALDAEPSKIVGGDEQDAAVDPAPEPEAAAENVRFSSRAIDFRLLKSSVAPITWVSEPSIIRFRGFFQVESVRRPRDILTV